jgi:Ring finger domain
LLDLNIRLFSYISTHPYPQFAIKYQKPFERFDTEFIQNCSRYSKIMIYCSTKAQKFWCAACIIWLICIFVVYRDDFNRSARPATVILFIGASPLMIFLISVARSKYQHSHRHQSRNTDPESSMISPEQREPPHGNLHHNSSIDHFLLTYMYRNNQRVEGNNCVVCLSQLKHGDMVVKIETCSHVFHEECIDRWLRLHKTCPICRSRVDNEAAQEPVVRDISPVV